MSFTIEQIVGNWVTASGGGVTIAPKRAGNTIYIISGAGSGANDTAPGTLSDTAGNSITTLGSVEVSGGGNWAVHGVIESCLLESTTIKMSDVQSGGTAVIAIEVAGSLKGGAVLASEIAVATIQNGSAPYDASIPTTATISQIPALAIVFGCTSTSYGAFTDGPRTGWTEGTIAWQTQPPAADTVIVQYMELTWDQAVQPAFPVASQYWYMGIGVVVFQVNPLPVPSAQWLEWISQPITPGMNLVDGQVGGFTAPTVIALCGPEAPLGSIVQVFPIAAGTSGTFVVNDCATVAEANAGNQIFSLDYSQISANTPIEINAPFRTGLVISSVPAGMQFAVLYDGPGGPGGTESVHAWS